MASVTELLAAAEAEKSPLIKLLEGTASGFAQGQNQFYDNAVKLVQAQRMQQEMQIQKQKEEERKQRFNALQQKISSFPQDKLKMSVGINADGAPVEQYETVDPTEIIPSQAMSLIDQGDLQGLSQLYPGGVPPRIATLATTNKSLKGVSDRFNTTSAAKVEEGKTRKTERLQDKFLNESKGFKDVAESYQRVLASAKDPSPAGDLALIFNYMKTLDPGSTVREGEFATAAQSGAFGDRIQAAVGKITSGERLSDEMRADFVNRSKLLYESQQSLQSQREQEFRRVGEGTGANLDKAIMKIGAPASQPAGKIRVSNGKETLEIDQSDESEAAKEGYRRIK